MNHLLLTKDRLDVGAVNELVTDDSCGAISMFIGTTRDNFEDKKVLTLEYEAYEPMALKQMEVICTVIRERWQDVVNIAVYHRLGLVPVREASVIIAVSSPHRQTSLEAVAFAIEELKRRVPIWKKEKYDANCKQRIKRPKLNFDDCDVQDFAAQIPNNLVQIAAKDQEIKRRIRCFVEKKREEIDANNIIDFTATMLPIKTETELEAEPETSTCARTNAIAVIKQEHSKCHLRVRRVENRVGPQTRPDYLQTLDKLMDNASSSSVKIKGKCPLRMNKQPYSGQLPDGVEQRLASMEEHLLLSSFDTKNIYQRLKTIENRILHLESLSPEYKHFLTENGTPLLAGADSHYTSSTTNKAYPMSKNKIYNVEELDSIIAQMQSDEQNQIDF